MRFSLLHVIFTTKTENAPRLQTSNSLEFSPMHPIVSENFRVSGFLLQPSFASVENVNKGQIFYPVTSGIRSFQFAF